MQLLTNQWIAFYQKERSHCSPPFDWSICLYCRVQKSYDIKHITREQRYTIQVMLERGFKQVVEIAKAIGKDKSTVSREIKRNKDKRNGRCRYDLAQRKYESRLKEKPKAIKFTEEVKSFVVDKIKLKWSPEQISNCREAQHLNMVSHERIYQFILEDKKQGG